jgi:SAM-dependent methyltransferase
MSSEKSSESAPYDLIASMYDQIYEEELSGRSYEATIVSGLCRRLRPEADSILDLGSGTGRVFRELTKTMKFNEMVGLEQSENMIDQASQNVSDAEFFQGDITNYDLGRKFDVITCLFDTINHISTGEGWRNMFQRSADHLKPGGLFMFDMATPYYLDKLTRLPEGYSWRFDGGMSFFSMRSIAPWRYQGEIEVIPTGNPDNRSKLTYIEATFPPEHVAVALKKYLKPVIAFDYNKALESEGRTLSPVTPKSNKIMFVSQKPDAA